MNKPAKSWSGKNIVRRESVSLTVKRSEKMNNLLRGLIAGYGAKKLGGGCLGTILVFILIWVALGQCN